MDLTHRGFTASARHLHVHAGALLVVLLGQQQRDDSNNERRATRIGASRTSVFSR